MNKHKHIVNYNLYTGNNSKTVADASGKTFIKDLIKTQKNWCTLKKYEFQVL